MLKMCITSLLSAVILLCAGSYANKIQPRIINGVDSQRGQFPYYAYLELFRSSKSGSACGAAILNENWLLTAAHCIEPNIVYIRVHLGLWQRRNVAEKSRLIRSAFPKRNGTFIHELYKGNLFVHDIALIKMSEPIEFNEYIQPIQIASDTGIDEMGDFKEFDVVAVGVGDVDRFGRRPEYLQYADLVTTNFAECTEIFPSVKFGGARFCAVNRDIKQALRKG